MDAAIRVTREVHDTLVQVLAERYGDQVEVLSAEQPDAGLVRYGALVGECFICDFAARPLSTRAASVIIRARLGRCYVGYRRALRWLAINRANNTVAVSVDEISLPRRELWVATNRLTLPGDTAGLKETLADLGTELARLELGLNWFPQLASGQVLTALEASGHELFAAVLAAPWHFRDWVLANRSEALEQCGFLPIHVLGWLGRWSENLDYLHEQYHRLSAEEQAAKRLGYLDAQVVALTQLGQHAAVLPLLDEMENLRDPRSRLGATCARMRALCALQQYEEALDVGRAATAEEDPRTWLWRSIAHAGLGQREATAASYAKYEHYLGTNVVARSELRRVLPAEWLSEDADDLPA